MTLSIEVNIQEAVAAGGNSALLFLPVAGPKPCWSVGQVSLDSPCLLVWFLSSAVQRLGVCCLCSCRCSFQAHQLGAVFPVEAVGCSFMKLGNVVGLAWAAALKGNCCCKVALMQSCVIQVRSEVPGCKGVISSTH